MSGICGLIHLDGAPVADTELAAMTAMLEQRGPHGTGHWRDGPVGLGHTLLATTPEAGAETQPLRHDATGCVITADVRLDNREELHKSLGLQKPLSAIGDAELVLYAWLKWGDQCPGRLLGDFAFAIYDPRDRKVFCARDHFGLRLFYYHHAPGKRFAFGSSTKAILVLPEVPYRINEGRVADFLVPALQWIDLTSTFFDGVFRLPPGHSITVTTDRIDVVEYWQPVPGPPLGEMSDADYREGFLEVFTQAVDARLRAPEGTVGSMLSGGLDSGTTVAVAREILRTRGDDPLPTYSAARRRGDDCDDCPESRQVYSSTSMPAIAPTLVHPDSLGDSAEAFLSDNEEPFDGEFSILRAIYRAGHQHGCRAMLDGAGGDVVFSEGTYVARLIRSGRLATALREIAGQRRYWGGPSVAALLIKHARIALVPAAVKRRLRGLANHRSRTGFRSGSLISPEFADRVDLDDRIARALQRDARSRDYAIERCNAIRRSVTAGRERYARIAAASTIEPRDAFLDRRVVDFCTQLPGRARLRDGWPKILLREAMAGRLPEDVRWATGRYHLGWLFNAKILEQAKARRDLTLDGLQRELEPYVDSNAMARAWKEMQDQGNAEKIFSAIVLANWLRETAPRPVVQRPSFL